MAKPKPPKLCVMFDTSILYTQVASELVRNSVKDLINENSDHTDLEVTWHIPGIVIGERKYQMLKQATLLLPSLQKMEHLLGHAFGIGEDTLELHVDRAVQQSVDDLGLEVTDIDTSEIDWEGVISRSVRRHPPFEENEKEKGFRDSIIAHSFSQLCASSPTTPSICRLVLVSGDDRLREYVHELTVASKNVRILASLDELESLINTLVSEIPEEFAAELVKKANKLFFEKENEKSFYYKADVRGQIQEQFSSELATSPIEKLVKNSSGKTWWIDQPVFIKKVKSRIYWTSSVQPEFELYHIEEKDNSKSVNPFLQTEKFTKAGLLSGLFETGEKIVDLQGRDIFEVQWSANLSAAKNLTSPRLEKIVYLGNNLPE